jgi:hypothetical protein
LNLSPLTKISGHPSLYYFPLQSSKTRSIKGFGKNISQPSLYINVSHLDISLLNTVSQEVVSPLKVSHSFMED